MNKELARQLVKTRKSVREKYQSLKSDIAQSQSQLEKGYKPITEPLQKLLSTIKTDLQLKQEPTNVKTESPTSTPKRESLNIYSKYLPMNIPSFLEDTYQNEPESVADEQNSDDLIKQEVERSRLFLQDLSNTRAYNDYLEAYDPLPRQYIDLSVRGDETDNDRQYGVKHDLETEKFKIGNLNLEIIGKDLLIGNVKYIGTPGLYELLFKKEPTGYKQTDLDNYIDILTKSNAYRRHYSSDEQIQGSQSEKYRTIIKPVLVKKGILKTGSIQTTFSKPPPPTRPLRKTQSFKHYTKGGLLNLSNRKVDYVYFDDPNELIDRLRLLIASEAAGNDKHNNEIISIIEELREAKIIK
jgi:hypothetical protein|uniref:DUF8207 domain-containing protein n=1 Tax=Anoplophora glabripennis TaxID=217634 RepID=V5I8K9_ANOGL